MAKNKESNFLSAVVYLPEGSADRAVPFLRMLHGQLEEHFKQYEIICVDDRCTDGTAETVRRWAAENLDKPMTILHMSLRQGRELCMNAGLDAAIGDFVYEFDTLQTPYAPEMIWQAYEKALEGNDIVTVGPEKTRAFSHLFYRIFNRFSRSAYPLTTDAFRLVSRRAINRVHAVSEHLPYRKAAYAASGLRVAALTFSGRLAAEDGERLDLAADSLALYTAAGYKLSLTVTVGMLLLTLAELVYTLAVALTGRPIEGWTTTMFVLTVGFSGVFLVLTLVIKYLSLLVDLVFRRQKYLVESIEKLQK